MDRGSRGMQRFPGFYQQVQPTKSMDLIDAAISVRREMLANMEPPYSPYYVQDHSRRQPHSESPKVWPQGRRTIGSAYNGRYPSQLSLQIPYYPQSPGDSLYNTPVEVDDKSEEELMSEPLEPIKQNPPPSAPQIHFSRTHEIFFIIAVCLAQFLSLAALAQTVAPLLLIGEDLKVEDPGQLAWFTASFSMTLGTFILPAGRVGDIVGHKKVFIIGWLWFALFSLVCGLSYVSGPIMLSIARAFQGIGPALLVPNAMALIGRTFPMGMKRNIVFSIFGACGPTGWTTGAVMSALLAERTWWPYVFFVTTIACTLLAVFSFIVIPDSLAVRSGPPGSSPPTFDYMGTVTGVSGLILINFSLNQAPLAGWSTPYVYFILIIGLLLTFFFLYIELYTAESPLLPLRSLQPSAAFTLSCIAAGWASHGIWIYYINLFLMRIRGVSPLLAQAQTCTVALTGTFFALSTGYLLNHMHVSTLMLLAMAVFGTGTALIAFMPAHQTYWGQTFISVLIMPAGMNWSFPAGTILLSNAMPKEMQGKAASLVATVVNYSIATGLGFAGSVERRINDDGTKILDGYRGAWHLGIGFSLLGMAISGYFIWSSKKEARRQKLRRQASSRSRMRRNYKLVK